MSSRVIKVMLVDDHILMREGIKKLLEFDNTIEVIEQASDGIECLEKMKTIKPDILLLDIDMPGMNGIKVLSTLKEQNNPVKVLILTVHSEIEYLVDAVDIGANGYILKDSGSADLKKAIEYIMEDNPYIQPSLIPALKSRLMVRDADKEKLEALTKRELEILTQVASGMFNKEIANNLNISERTVKNHVSNIFRKLTFPIERRLRFLPLEISLLIYIEILFNRFYQRGRTGFFIPASNELSAVFVRVFGECRKGQ